MDGDFRSAVGTCIARRLRRNGLQLAAQISRVRIVLQRRDGRVHFADDIEDAAAVVKNDMARTRARRHGRFADQNEIASLKAQYLNLVDAEISRGEEAAGRIEHDLMRMGTLLPFPVGTAAL